MTTALELWNGAIDRIGGNLLASIEGTDPTSRRLRRRMPEAIQEAFENYPVNFAMKRAQLTAAVDEESVSHTYVYQRPGWLLRTVAFSIDGTDEGTVRRGFREEGGLVHANWPTLYVIGTTRDKLEAYGSFPQLFRRWLQLDLAAAICPATEDARKLDEIKKERDAAWTAWTLADAQAGPEEPRPMGRWNRSRRGIGDGRGYVIEEDLPPDAASDILIE